MNLTEWKQIMNLSGTAINIDDIPSEIDVAPVRHGRWIIDPQSQYGFPLHIYLKRKCSECGHSVDNPTPYCPWCGATMDAERKEE